MSGEIASTVSRTFEMESCGIFFSVMYAAYSSAMSDVSCGWASIFLKRLSTFELSPPCCSHSATACLISTILLSVGVFVLTSNASCSESARRVCFVVL